VADQRKTVPCGFWTGLFDVKTLFAKPATPTYPLRHRGCTYWLEARAGEGGRVVLMQRGETGSERCLTPEAFSIRSRVHEYGGCPYTVQGASCYFVNDSDQRIYVQRLNGESEPVPITPPDELGGGRRYIDLCVAADGEYLVCVMEHEVPDDENRNLLAFVRLQPGFVHEPGVLHDGHDFYANVVLDNANRRIAWVQWDHPDMPWDRSNAMLGFYRDGPDGLTLHDVECVIGQPDTSVCQLEFADDGGLIMAIDGNGAPGTRPDFWNLFHFRDGRFTQLTFDGKEYGAPHWVFGDRRYVVLEDGILAVRTGPEGDELVMVDKNGGGAREVETDAVDIRQLSRAGPNEALMMSAARDRSPVMTLWQHGRLAAVNGVKELLPDDAVSRPRAVLFPSGEGMTAHAYFYPPCNPHYRAPAGESPPLLVMVHGGPTARCSNALDLTRQYWTGIGFAVLDVNYRGSTGYGRAYRQSLLGQWGLYDTEDVVKAIEYVVRRGWVDKHRVFIRGRSAGGYAVLSALTRFPAVFAAGACYYGIGNLVTLAQITHKFEGRYTDRLIGEPYRPGVGADRDSRFYTRSPIRFVSAIHCPVIVFQGLEDKVVPPDVSREIALALEQQGLEYEYVEYPGEGHGFRSSEANIDALQRETGFFRNVLDAARGVSKRDGQSSES
jgi:dipeptidyl aminopeptidase/acylaminoacyl peptidase